MRSERKTAVVSGSVPRMINGSEIEVIGRTVNYNADVLEELIKRVERLEKKVSESE